MPNALLTQWVEKLLAIDQLRDFTRTLADGADSREFCHRLRERLGITIAAEETELRHIPARGPAVVVANHSYGLTDAVITSNLLFRRREDIRYLANEQVLGLEGVRRLVFPVDLSGSAESRRANARSLRKSLEWLDQGGLLVVFPAGEVAHWQWKRMRVTEPEWNENAVRLARRSGAKVVPMWIDGANSAAFHLAGLAHPVLRTAMLPREFLRRRDCTIRVRIGHAATAEWVERRGDDATAYLRERCESLRPRRRGPAFRMQAQRRLIDASGTAALRAEIAELPEERRLAAGGQLEVWHLQAEEAPAVMREIGRLREFTFRAVGEGTGKPCDLDRFDAYYQQLVLWDTRAGAVAGGYRIHTRPGGYVSTLFRLSPEFHERLGPAVELGRSFIAEGYQRQYESLLLLWKGIGAWVAAHPEFGTLYGPVSISNAYSPLARASLVHGLRRLAWREDLAPFARPRIPFVSLWKPVVAYDLDELDALVADIDGPGSGAPVLVRQYLKLGGKLAAFHVDPSFGNTVDGLIVVDLRRAPRKLLERYMGAEGAAKFLG
ncbi:MAG TPA: GNAT family N-acyltransferase [Bryobacteraceae bacterium]|nr:GNAT family N-acyltransferase [Bryobacteraceae bacterium]